MIFLPFGVCPTKSYLQELQKVQQTALQEAASDLSLKMQHLKEQLCFTEKKQRGRYIKGEFSKQ